MYVSVRSDVAYLPLGIHVEIESLKLDFHVLPTWMIDVEAPGNRVFETRFPIRLFQIFRLYSLTLTHTHTPSLSHKPEHSHSLSLTYIFISHTKVSFLTQSFYSQNSLIFSLSLTRPLTFAHAHTHTQPRQRQRAEPSPAQPSPATTPTRLSPAIDSSPP